ncbi:hypothetical protein [Pasteuria penetrans]|uniref:hypothetical protein n=1 Tax=Pasteuria penetrans TaxID=86005 RepID=UPI0011EDBFC6|nr:hypothetical protein [Pasteuria penetrans]
MARMGEGSLGVDNERIEIVCLPWFLQGVCWAHSYGNLVGEGARGKIEGAKTKTLGYSGPSQG